MDTQRKNDWLLEHRSNVTSQHGEDGIVQKIFEIIGEGSKWCAELGALNGRHDSNVWHLVQECGWSGVLIEADPTYFERLAEEYKHTPQAHCVQAFVSFEGEKALDSLFAKTPMPRVFDLFSLDVDGNEYHLWESLEQYRPRVMVVEFNPSIPNDVSFVQPRDMSVYQGSSLCAFVALGKEKGYELVATNETNAFFVSKELFSLFGITDNSIDALHTDRQFETKLFQLYDGTLVLAGNDRLIWHNVQIDPERLQVLPRRRRVYPARISPHSTTRSLKYWVRKLPFYVVLQKVRKSFFM